MLQLPENSGGRKRYLCKHYQRTPRGIVIEKSYTDEGKYLYRCLAAELNHSFSQIRMAYANAIGAKKSFLQMKRKKWNVL